MYRPKPIIRPGKLGRRKRPPIRAVPAIAGAGFFCLVVGTPDTLTVNDRVAVPTAFAEADFHALAEIEDPVLRALMFDRPQGGASSALYPRPASLSRIPPHLSGRWTDTELELDFDAAAHLARLNDGPWEAFQVKDFSGRMLVFVVGKEQFIGLLGDESLQVSRFRDPKQRVLYRSPFRSTLKS